MDNDAVMDLRERIARLEQDEESVHRRLDSLETLIESIHNIALEMKEMRVDLKAVRADVGIMNARVDEIEQTPKKRYDTIIVAIITGIATLATTLIAGYIANNI